MRTVPTPGLSVKVATALDILSTIIATQIGYMFSLPIYHPIVLGYAVGTTYALFKWKDNITTELIRLSGPLQNKNKYDYFNKLLASKIRFKILLLREMFEKKKERKKEVYLFFDSNTN